MSSGFSQKEVVQLLAACHRRCCICHRFCGVKIETDHIVPAADGGADDIDNAIPVCFECHAEIHSYNDKHPRGRKLRPEELRAHKEQWLAICKQKPEIFVHSTRDTDVGPLQALIDELEFNLVVAEKTGPGSWGCEFSNEQFQRAVRAGAIATLQDDLKRAVLNAYYEMGQANQMIATAVHLNITGARGSAVKNAVQSASATKNAIQVAMKSLVKFLASE